MNEADNQKDSEALMWDTLLVDMRIATMAEAQGYGIIEHGAIGIHNGEIIWVGAMAELPGAAEKLANDVIESNGIWVTPGLIDCHTHLVYAGHDGQSVEAVAQATRDATEDQLLEASARRLVALLEEGVTTVGIQSGYGLDTQCEEKLEAVVRLLEGLFPMNLLTRFNGERSLPEAYAANMEAYSEEGIRTMRAARQAAIVLPGVFFTLGLTQKPLVAMMREYGVPMVLSTDCNPISSPSTSLLLMLNMACRLFGLTPPEALHSVTSHVAKALGADDDIGTITVGKLADLALWDIVHPDELSHQLGYNPCFGIIKNGVLRRTRE